MVIKILWGDEDVSSVLETVSGVESDDVDSAADDAQPGGEDSVVSDGSAVDSSSGVEDSSSSELGEESTIVDSRPFLTTPFEEYTVTEGFLLCIFVFALVAGVFSLVLKRRWL